MKSVNVTRFGGCSPPMCPSARPASGTHAKSDCCDIRGFCRVIVVIPGTHAGVIAIRDSCRSDCDDIKDSCRGDCYDIGDSCKSDCYDIGGSCRSDCYDIKDLCRVIVMIPGTHAGVIAMTSRTCAG